MKKLDLEVLVHQLGAWLANLRVQTTLIDRIKVKQNEYPHLQKIRKGMEVGGQVDFSIHVNWSLRFHGRLCVPDDSKLKNEILKEAYSTRFSIHSGSTKMCKDLR